MKASSLLLSMALVVGMAAGTFADDTWRNAVEKHQDRKDIRQDRAALADDQADLDRLSDLIIEYNSLVSAGAGQSDLDQVRASIAVELRRDLAENAYQTKDARKETAESRRELRSDRREVRDDRQEAVAGTATPREKHELRDDRRDKRDDRRDLRDDKADLARATELLNAKRRVASELRDIQAEIDRTGDSDLLRTRQAELLNEYLTLSNEEIALGLRERTEDRRELLEDRRETREDRRQGN